MSLSISEWSGTVDSVEPAPARRTQLARCPLTHRASQRATVSASHSLSPGHTHTHARRLRRSVQLLSGCGGVQRRERERTGGSTDVERGTQSQRERERERNGRQGELNSWWLTPTPHLHFAGTDTELMVRDIHAFYWLSWFSFYGTFRCFYKSRITNNEHKF